MRRLRSASAVLALSGVVTGVLVAQTPAAVRIDPAWLHADSAASSVEFSLIAGLSGANGGMNFNGASNGALTLVVPVGWHVLLKFKNEDQNMPHSAEVTRATTPIPVGPVPPSFAHAATHRLAQGMASDSHEDVRFDADHAGAYLIYCAVPGHGAAGMWLKLDVNDTATHPSVVAAVKAGS